MFARHTAYQVELERDVLCVAGDLAGGASTFDAKVRDGGRQDRDIQGAGMGLEQRLNWRGNGEGIGEPSGPTGS